ncbi:hypothetical protein N7490_004087 [Penicillium lividum]|nr:hypothetical protein N7490_004087 [Penicillium lividum]
MFNSDDYLMKFSLRAVSNGRKTSDSGGNIFSSVFYESEKSALTDKEMAIEAGNMIVAGSDTTAVTLTYLIWIILSHPKVRADLEKELAGAAPGGEFDDTALEALPLLNAIIMETLQLYGAAPGALPRGVPEGGATFDKYFIPEGFTAIIQTYTIHRDPSLYPNPETFDPSRWIASENQVSDRANQGFSPFGTGSRTCLGIHLSWVELRLATAKFFHRCKNVRLAASVTEENMRPTPFFLITPYGHKCEIVTGA